MSDYFEGRHVKMAKDLEGDLVWADGKVWAEKLKVFYEQTRTPSWTTMSIPEFSLRLQHSITGGFTPPTPEAIITITGILTQNLLNISSVVTRP
ncbi:hypothetical protein C8Q78DRAFT_1083693 [Trametes maxima]|nr:hypothetical protein C8Q78DRAFT_1083693 [Trametes maxima]